MIFAGLTLIGLFAAIYHPVGIAWIVASAHKQGMTLGINGGPSATPATPWRRCSWG